MNTTGGYLVCGIQEPGKIIGLDLSEDIVAEIARKLHDGISPKSLVSIQAQMLEEKTVLVIEVQNGGDVLFARNPAARLPQIRIRAMRYNSDKAGDKLSDMKSFEGPLHGIFEEAYTFIIRNTPSISRFVKENPKRQDSPLYPEDAVREALINALAHRDYSAASGGVSIHVFPQRLEIWNSGPLPDGVTEENLLKGHISVLRNPDIAHALYLRGLMEKAGRGSVIMVQQCREAGLPDPFWKSDPKLGVTVTFRTPEVTPEVRRLIQHLKGEMLRRDLQSAMGLKDDEHFRKAYLLPALESGFMLWDGLSKGTLNNILNLLERGKKVVVYFSPARECLTLRRIADVIPLLENCPKMAMEEFASKIDLAARIAQPQARFNLV